MNKKLIRIALDELVTSEGGVAAVDKLLYIMIGIGLYANRENPVFVLFAAVGLSASLLAGGVTRYYTRQAQMHRLEAAHIDGQIEEIKARGQTYDKAKEILERQLRVQQSADAVSEKRAPLN